MLWWFLLTAPRAALQGIRPHAVVVAAGPRTRARLLLAPCCCPRAPSFHGVVEVNGRPLRQMRLGNDVLVQLLLVSRGRGQQRGWDSGGAAVRGPQGGSGQGPVQSTVQPGQGGGEHRLVPSFPPHQQPALAHGARNDGRAVEEDRLGRGGWGGGRRVVGDAGPLPLVGGHGRPQVRRQGHGRADDELGQWGIGMQW